MVVIVIYCVVLFPLPRSSFKLFTDRISKLGFQLVRTVPLFMASCYICWSFNNVIRRAFLMVETAVSFPLIIASIFTVMYTLSDHLGGGRQRQSLSLIIISFLFFLFYKNFILSKSPLFMNIILCDIVELTNCIHWSSVLLRLWRMDVRRPHSLPKTNLFSWGPHYQRKFLVFTLCNLIH